MTAIRKKGEIEKRISLYVFVTLLIEKFDIYSIIRLDPGGVHSTWSQILKKINPTIWYIHINKQINTINYLRNNSNYSVEVKQIECEKRNSTKLICWIVNKRTNNSLWNNNNKFQFSTSRTNRMKQFFLLIFFSDLSHCFHYIVIFRYFCRFVCFPFHFIAFILLPFYKSNISLCVHQVALYRQQTFRPIENCDEQSYWIIYSSFIWVCLPRFNNETIILCTTMNFSLVSAFAPSIFRYAVENWLSNNQY